MRHQSTVYDGSRSAPLPLLDVNGTAVVLNCDRSTVYRLLRDGDLSAVRVGKRRRIRPEDIESYLERGREGKDTA